MSVVTVAIFTLQFANVKHILKFDWYDIEKFNKTKKAEKSKIKQQRNAKKQQKEKKNNKKRKKTYKNTKKNHLKKATKKCCSSLMWNALVFNKLAILG